MPEIFAALACESARARTLVGKLHIHRERERARGRAGGRAGGGAVENKRPQGDNDKQGNTRGQNDGIGEDVSVCECE